VPALTFLVGSLLAFANGANDNFKGVATLLGTGTTSYRGALLWTTIATGLGSAAALILARGLLAAFSGKGLVPPEVVANPAFPLSVAAAAGATVMLATRFGFPVSTTHALIGALVGAGLITSPEGVDFDRLGRGFLLPLLTSPFLAILLAAGLYPLLRFFRSRLGVEQETCICVENEVVGVVPGNPGAELALQTIGLPTLKVGPGVTCSVRYRGRVAGISARSLLDVSHFLSAGVVSFARGLNDTPKIAALLLVGGLLSPSVTIVAVGVAIAIGGLTNARRVAETMSYRVTDMNPGQGFTANVVTGVLVVGASVFGVPVSTTHVSCGSLFGIGTITRKAHTDTIRQILLAWVTTLPVAAALASLFVSVFQILV
jgi:PiT family inorganic phosphate transporter